MKNIAAATALAIGLAGCATDMGRINSYGMHLADAKTTSDGHLYSLYFHKTDNTILVQPSMGRAVGTGLVKGATFGLAGDTPTQRPWRAAVEQFLKPTGCTVTGFDDLGQHTTWEATYACPAGVDLRKLAAAQRPALQHGEPIHL